MIKRITAIAQKEWIQIYRDIRSLVLALILPIFMILIFGYALNMDVKNVKFVIYNQDNSFISRQFIESFLHNDYLINVGYVQSYKDLSEYIDSGKAVAGIVIPYNFTKNIKSGKTVDLQLILDASDSMSATVANGYFTSIVNEYNINNLNHFLNKYGSFKLITPIKIESRIWYNETLESKNFIIPGLIVIIMSIISALITSLTISKEWERGTMETLITTPIKSHEIIIGKLIPYIFIGLFDVTLTYVVGYFLFNIPIRGNFAELLIVSILFLIGTSTLGIVISSATKVQVLSIQVAMLVTYLPSIILSGFVFPIKNMPLIIQFLTYLIPARYMVYLVKAIALKGLAVSLVYWQIIFMFIFAFAMLGIAMKKVKLQYAQ